MEKTVVATLRLRVDEYLAGLARAKIATTEFGKHISGTSDLANANVTKVGHAALLMGAGVAAGLGLAAKAAIDWESSWADVSKTVSGSKQQMADLEAGLRGVATTLPATHQEIAAVAAAAGQLGIARGGIVEFTKVMVALQATTIGLSADEAATGIAKIMNVMQTPLGDVDRFGAALLALGNVGASTEAEILDMASRLAGAGKLVGASEADILGLANAMTSMGIQSHLGGGAFSRILLKMYSDVKSGGDKLRGFAQVAGMTAQQFATAFEKEPIRAVDAVVKGLGTLDASGGNVVSTLSNLGIKGTQELQVMLKLKGSGDLLSQSLDIGTKAWADNTALAEAAAKRYATTASQLQVLKNNVVDLGIKFGGVMLPAIKAVTSALTTMVSGFGSLPPAARNVGVALGAILVAGLGMVGMLGTFGPKVEEALVSLRKMGAIGNLVANNLGMIAGGIGIAVAAFAIYSYVVGVQAKREAEAKARTDAYTDAILKQGAATGSTTDSLGLTAVMVGSVGQALRNSGTDLHIFQNAMNTGGTAGQKMRNDLRDLQLTLSRGQGPVGWLNSIIGAKTPMESFIGQLKAGKLGGTELGSTLLALGQNGDVSTGDMAKLVARLREQNDALAQGQIEAKNKAAADQAVALQAGPSATAAGRLAAAMQSQAAATADATQNIKDLNDAEHAALDPLFAMYEATKANADAQAAVTAAQGGSGVSAAKMATLNLAASRAQDAVNKAQASGKTSAATMAALNAKLATSQDAVTKAQTGTSTSTAAMSALHEAAAKSALDMDVAATTLSGSIRSGAVNLDIAKAQLKEWVANGMVSVATAKVMAAQFDAAAGKANSVAGERTATLGAVDNATPVIDPVLAKLDAFKAYNGSTVQLIVKALVGDLPITTGDPLKGVPLPPAVHSLLGSGNAAGGWAGMGTPLAGPTGTDTIPTFLTPGEFVVDAKSARANAGALEHLNRTGTLVGAAGARFTGPSSSSSSAAASAPIVVHPAPVNINFNANDPHFKAFMRSWIKAEGGNVQKVLGPKGRV